MRKSATFDNVFFDAPTLRSAVETVERIGVEALQRAPENYPGTEADLRFYSRDVSRHHESWSFDTIDEFLVDLTNATNDPTFRDAGFAGTLSTGTSTHILTFSLRQYRTHATLDVNAQERAAIERVHAVFKEAANRLRVEPPEPPAIEAPKPRIFIGHGGTSSAWKDLHIHLKTHGLETEAYETGSRAGHTIRDVLEQMLESSTFAILVMTKEDEQPSENEEEPRFRARQNVVHEAGLFQGRLGFSRTIILREDDVDLFSNVDGIQYVGFTSHIRETYGEVLGAIRREFGPF